MIVVYRYYKNTTRKEQGYSYRLATLPPSKKKYKNSKKENNLHAPNKLLSFLMKQ